MKVLERMHLKNLGGRIAVVAGLAVALSFPASAAYAKQVRLFVDPGHGGKDPGAVSRGIKEKDTNLAISREVVKAAKRQGWKVKMSRNSDRFVSLRARPRIAARWKATSTVSIHSNSTGRKALGNMTIYKSKKSKKLGKAITKELSKTTSYRDIGNRRDVRGLAVLRTKRPTVIVEVLSVTAPKEKRRLKSPGERKKMAEAIVRGVAKAEGVKYVPPKAKAKPKAAPKPTEKAARKPGPAPSTPATRPSTPSGRPEGVPTTSPAVPTLTVSAGLTTASSAPATRTSPVSPLRIETRPSAPLREASSETSPTLLARLLRFLVR